MSESICYVTLNPSLPSGNGEVRYNHIWCKDVQAGEEMGIPVVRMVGFNGGAMVIPTYIGESVPSVLAVNQDPALWAFKPDHSGQVAGHLVL